VVKHPNFIPKSVEERSVMEAISKERGFPLKFVNVYCSVTDILDGSVYYAEFVSKDDGEDFVYVYVHKSQIEVYEDGIQLVQRLLERLMHRRSILQRMQDFTMTELVCALITVSLVVGVIVSACATGDPNKELVGLLSLVIGYYFGRHTGGK
jgi:hypothetical protein